MLCYSYYLCVEGADVELAGDIDKPLFCRVKVRETNTPRAVDNKDEVVYCCAAPWTHSDQREISYNTDIK